MDDQFFSAFKRFQEQQERINNLMRSPAMEMIKKQQESMQRIIGSSVNEALLNHQENVRLIVQSPAFDMLQKHQENWHNIMGSSAVMAFENNLGVKTVLGNQLFDNWNEQQNRINKMINPTVHTILVEHQERWNSIFQKVSNFGINSSIFEEIVEELKEVYAEIDDDTVPSANEEGSSQKTRKEIQEFKKQLQDIISYCIYVAGIIHVVDTKVIWDILTKISVIMTILNPVFNEDVNQGVEKNVQIIKVNGDNNTINIENSNSGTIIIQTNNNETEIIIKNEAQNEMEDSNNDRNETSDLDISAGIKS